MILALGVDPSFYLNCEDPAELRIWESIVQRAVEERVQMDQNLATLIINQLAKALKK